MVCRLLLLTLSLVCFSFLGAIAEETPGEPVASKSIEALCTEFGQFDRNADGQTEITSLKPIASAGTAGSRVPMFFEPWLLDPLDGAADLLPHFARWADGLAAEGHRVNVISVELAKSEIHQDGQFILALREGANYGKAWPEYFRIKKNSAKPLPPASHVGRKRAYYWGVLGDWTLRLATAAAAEDS